MHEIFNYTLASYNSTSVQLHRQWINASIAGAYRTADLHLNVVGGAQLDVTPGNNGSYTPPTVNILVGNRSGIVQVRFVTNETSLAGLSPPDLFLPEGSVNSSALNTALAGLANGMNQIAEQVRSLLWHLLNFLPICPTPGIFPNLRRQIFSGRVEVPYGMLPHCPAFTNLTGSESTSGETQ